MRLINIQVRVPTVRIFVVSPIPWLRRRAVTLAAQYYELATTL
jgi:hypothetical protein